MICDRCKAEGSIMYLYSNKAICQKCHLSTSLVSIGWINDDTITHYIYCTSPTRSIKRNIEHCIIILREES